MSAGVHVHHLIMNHIGAFAEQGIFKALHRAFVAGDNRRGKNHGIAHAQFNFAMFAAGNAHQRGVFFALRAGANHHHLIIRIFIYLAQVNQRARIKFDVAQFLGDFHIAFHAKTAQRHHLAVFFADFNNLSDTREQGREGADNHAARGFSDNFFQVGLDFRLGDLVTGRRSVGRIGQQSDDAFTADAGNALQIRGRFAGRLIVKFPIARMHDSAFRGMHHHAHGVKNIVIDVEKFQLKMPQAKLVV